MNPRPIPGRSCLSTLSTAGLARTFALALIVLWLTQSRAEANQGEEERPHEPLPNPLRLEHVLQFARSHRAEITAAWARARAAAQRPAIVAALDDPMVSPSLDHLPFRFHGADFSLTVEQRFPLSHVRGNRRKAAEAEAMRLRAESNRVSLDVELDAANAYLMLNERRQMSLILEQQLALAGQLVTAANARYAGGMGAQPDVLRSEVEVSRLQSAARAIRSEVRSAEAMLNTSLARPTDAAVPALQNTVEETDPEKWRELRDTTLRNRPELAAGRSEISRAQAEVSVMKSMYSPMAMVRTGPAYSMTDGPGWMLMLGISVPIWRDRLRSGVREMEAMVDMTRADLSAMSRMIEGEAATARYRVLASRDRFLALRDDVLPRTRRVIEPSIASYAAGTLPLVSVIDAAQTLWSVEAELIAAELELGLAWARLNRAAATSERTPL